MLLQTNQTYQLWVQDITPQSEPFQLRNEPWYSHSFILVDEFKEPYLCQVCDKFQQFNACKVGEQVEITVKSISREKHTVAINRVIVPVQPKHKTPTPVEATNPLVNGTAAAVSLTLAVELAKFNPNVQVLDQANEFFDWFNKKVYPS